MSHSDQTDSLVPKRLYDELARAAREDVRQTDRQILEDLLGRRGFGWTAKPDAIELEAKKGGIGGYGGFAAVFEFNDAGALVAIEVWE